MSGTSHVNCRTIWLLLIFWFLVGIAGEVSGYQEQPGANNQDSSDHARYALYASRLFEQYDRNKDGFLNEVELSKMRRPLPNADSNGDGKVELAEIISQLSSGSRGANSQVQVGRDKATGNVSRATKYADVLIKQYDGNNDGVLDREELAKMRRPPRADADVDADGILDRKELVDAILNRKQSQAQMLADLLGGASSGDVLSNLPAGGGGIMSGDVLGNLPDGAWGTLFRTESPKRNARREPGTGNNDAAETRAASVNFHLLQLDGNIAASKLNDLAKKINQSDEEFLVSLLEEFGQETVLSDDQVYTTLLANHQFEYQGGGSELQVTGRRVRQDGALSYDSREVDVGFKLSLVPEFHGDRISLGVEVQKSFVDTNAKPINDSGVKLHLLRNFELKTKLSLTNRGAAASVFSGAGRQWLMVVTGQFE